MDELLSTEHWGEETSASDVVNPVVFHFKPKQFVKVSPENLAKWEEFFLQHVGLRPVPQGQPGAAERLPAWYGSPGGSISGSNGDWDDCDI